jgi:peptidoglycan lytic transglycosylase
MSVVERAAWLTLARAGACVSVLGLLAACAGGPTRSVEEPATVINAPPSSRGNPLFYEVLGKRYYVLQSSEGYRERGIASWYGTDFHGLSTASGEPYDMYALTAAHKTLPIPTWAEVTNLGNGKRVIVKINDRGPFVADRIIDLSYSAAKALDIIGAGTAMVEVRALGVSAAAPIGAGAPTLRADNKPPDRSFALIRSADAATVGATDVPARQMFAQVGAFSDRTNADKLLARLKAAGYANAFILSDGRRALHRVRIGPLAGAGDFDSLRARLRSVGISQTQLIVGQ